MNNVGRDIEDADGEVNKGSQDPSSMQIEVGPKERLEWQRRVRAFGVVANALTNAWLDLDSDEDTECLINQTDEQHRCKICSEISLTIDTKWEERVEQSFEVFAQNLWGWIDETENLSTQLGGIHE